MGYTLYPPEAAGQIAIKASLDLAPLILLGIVSRRMGHGWLVISLPWLVVAAAFAIYGAPVIQFSRKVLGVSPLWPIFAHLLDEVAPVSVILTLVVLALMGAKSVATAAERA